jgi:hypothetical protein
MQALPDGKYRDILRRADGSSVDFGWRSNIIVDQCRELLAAFMLGGPASGIQHLELGRGQAIWDLTPPAPPAPGTTGLTDTTPVTVEVADLQLDYLDAAGNTTATPQHRIQVTLELAPGILPITGDQVYPLREFALFGELDGDAYMIDYVRHPVMNIAVGDILTRTIRLIF